MNDLIKSIEYDSDYSLGCESCDYGSSYINQLTIEFQDGIIWEIEIDNMYDYALTESDLIKICVNSNSKEEIKNEILKAIEEEGASGADFSINGETYLRE